MKHSRYNYITPEKDGFFLLFNTAKETLVELDAEMLNYYESNTLDSETQAAMTELGFLVDDSFDELESLEATWRKNFEESSTLDLNYHHWTSAFLCQPICCTDGNHFDSALHGSKFS